MGDGVLIAAQVPAGVLKGPARVADGLVGAERFVGGAGVGEGLLVGRACTLTLGEDTADGDARRGGVGGVRERGMLCASD